MRNKNQYFINWNRSLEPTYWNEELVNYIFNLCEFKVRFPNRIKYVISSIIKNYQIHDEEDIVISMFKTYYYTNNLPKEVRYDYVKLCIDKMIEKNLLNGVRGCHFDENKTKNFTSFYKQTENLKETMIMYAGKRLFYQQKDKNLIILKGKDKKPINYEKTELISKEEKTLDEINKFYGQFFISLLINNEDINDKVFIKNVCKNLKYYWATAFNYINLPDNEKEQLETSNKNTLPLPSSQYSSTFRQKDIQGNNFSQVLFSQGKQDFIQLFPFIYSVFNIDFKHGGRFYGSQIEELSGEQRQNILIDGVKTVELDYASFHPRMCYHLSGLEYESDAYTLNIPMEEKDKDNVRNIVKQIFCASLNSSSKVKAKQSIQSEINKHNIVLPDYLTLDYLFTCFELQHKQISHMFYKGKGLELQFIDREIAKDIILYFKDRTICCLSIHDSFIVPSQHRMTLKIQMQLSYQKYINGFMPKIK